MAYIYRYTVAIIVSSNLNYAPWYKNISTSMRKKVKCIDTKVYVDMYILHIIDLYFVSAIIYDNCLCRLCFLLKSMKDISIA